MEAKRLLRSRLLSSRARRSTTDLVAAGRAIAQHGHGAWKRSGAIAAYAGVGTEPPTQPLLDALRDAGVQVLLPVVTNRGLDWAAYDSWDRLVTAANGLLEPAGPRLGSDAIRSAAVLVVPALAVDLAGHRLGRGRGFYDRALDAGAGARSVAVVFDDELLDEVPVEPHDIDVGAVLRPAGLLQCGL
jgi:5-formyltetrahydrofolate cyclo-ligase